jgi:DNA repair photolyase
MEEGLAVKINAPQVLEKQLALRARKNEFGFVAVGSATDAYIHHEEKHKTTQQILEVLLKYRFPVFISTKCTLITRDLDLLREIDNRAILPQDLAGKLKRGLVLSVSVSTMNEKISNMLEPGAAPPLQRLQLVRRLKQEGFLTGVNAIPVLPFVSDTAEELEKIIAAAKEYGADYILVGGLTLFGTGQADSKTLVYKFIERYDHSLLPKYQHLYGSNFYVPFRYQEELKQKADPLCEKYAIRNRIIE